MNKEQALVKVKHARALYEKSAVERTESKDRLIDAARAARDSGASMTHIAQAAGLSRKSLYVWIGATRDSGAAVQDEGEDLL